MTLEKKCPNCNNQCIVENKCTFEENPEEVKQKGIKDMIDYLIVNSDSNGEHFIEDIQIYLSKNNRTEIKKKREIVFRMNYVNGIE